MAYRAGKIILLVGVLTLAAGLICTMTIGTFAVPVLLFTSIILNSTGIVLMRQGK